MAAGVLAMLISMVVAADPAPATQPAAPPPGFVTLEQFNAMKLERDRLGAQLRAAMDRVQELHAENAALKKQLKQLGAQVIPLRKPEP